MNQSLKVSVIIPCYNVEKYISKCLSSIFNQSYRNIEIICINDGSSDKTLEILTELKALSPFDFEIETQPNTGACVARNRGISLSKGTYIQFLDADDFLSPKKIENQINLAQNNSQPDLIVGSYERINENNQLLFNRIYKENIEDKWLLLMKGNLGNTCSNLFNKTIFSNGLKWDKALKSSQEYNLLFNILKDNYSLVYDKEINTTIVTRESGSISKKDIKGNWERYTSLRLNIYKFLKLNDFFGDSKDNYQQMLFEAIRMLFPYNKKLALTIFNNNIDNDFVPKSSTVVSNSYIKLYKIFGFRITEYLKNLFKS